MKNDTSLKMLKDFPNFFAIFKQGASRSAASGGSEFSKMSPFFGVGMFSGDLEAKPRMLSKVCVSHEAI